MCGIIGIASTEYQAERQWLGRACGTMIHRGPDGFGEWWSSDGRIGFAHRRLAIHDLSILGSQPMQYKNPRLTIIFNGEIYNYVDIRKMLLNDGYIFSTECDTEVLLAAYAKWGKRCLDILVGMFAFAIYDWGKSKVFIARDRIGEKPLYYIHQGNRLLFGSEAKALILNPGVNKKVDYESLNQYLAVGYVPSSKCMISGIKKLLPGHALSYDLASGSLHVWRYWDLPLPDNGDRFRTDNDIVAETEKCINEAVKLVLSADVPVGLLLSGGLDSSLVAAFASRHCSNLKSYCFGVSGDTQIDETRHAKLISDYFGLNHHEIYIDLENDLDFEKIVTQFDDPIGDSSVIPTFLVSKKIKELCTVAIGGDGGDEVFGGYKHYSRMISQRKIAKVVPQGIRKVCSQVVTHLFPIGTPGRRFVQTLSGNFIDEIPCATYFFDRRFRKRLGLPSSFNSDRGVDYLFLRQVKGESLLDRAMRSDFHNYLSEDILVKVDRASMMNSLEIRAPLLDHRLVDLSFRSIPQRLKIDGDSRKIILKKIGERLLPKSFNYKRKQGFSIPLRKWIKSGPLRELFWDTLNSSRCCFDRCEIQNLLRAQETGIDHSDRLYALVAFEMWRQRYSISL